MQIKWKLLEVEAWQYHSYEHLNVKFENPTFIQGMCTFSRTPIFYLLRFIRDLLGNINHSNKYIKSKDYRSLIRYCVKENPNEDLKFCIKVLIGVFRVQYFAHLSFLEDDEKLCLHSESVFIYDDTNNQVIWESCFHENSGIFLSFWSFSCLKKQNRTQILNSIEDLNLIKKITDCLNLFVSYFSYWKLYHFEFYPRPESVVPKIFFWIHWIW